MTLDEVKLFLRVDETDEDELIESLQLGAEAYLSNAGITKDYSNELYVVAAKLLINNWYSNRDLFVSGKVEKIMFSLENIIYSIKYNQPVVTP